MDHSQSEVLEKQHANFLDIASNWYLGGHRNMPSGKIPPMFDIALILRALSFNIIDFQETSQITEQNDIEPIIEITLKNPFCCLVMSTGKLETSVAQTSKGAEEENSTELGLKQLTEPACKPNLPDVSEDKQIVVQEVLQLLIEFIHEVKQTTPTIPNNLECASIPLDSLHISQPPNGKLIISKDEAKLPITSANLPQIIMEKEKSATIDLDISMEEDVEWKASSPNSHCEGVSHITSPMFGQNITPIRVNVVRSNTWIKDNNMGNVSVSYTQKKMETSLDKSSAVQKARETYSNNVIPKKARSQEKENWGASSAASIASTCSNASSTTRAKQMRPNTATRVLSRPTNSKLKSNKTYTMQNTSTSTNSSTSSSTVNSSNASASKQSIQIRTRLREKNVMASTKSASTQQTSRMPNCNNPKITPAKNTMNSSVKPDKSAKGLTSTPAPAKIAMQAKKEAASKATEDRPSLLPRLRLVPPAYEGMTLRKRMGPTTSLNERVESNPIKADAKRTNAYSTRNTKR